MESLSILLNSYAPLVFVPIILISSFFFMLRYLNRDGTNANASKKEEEILKKLEALEDRIEYLQGEGGKVFEEQRAIIVAEVKDRINEQAIDEIIQELQYQAGNKDEFIRRISEVEQQKYRTLDRLRQELYSLGRRANVNLAIGSTTAIFGLYLLWSLVVERPIMPSMADLARFLAVALSGVQVDVGAGASQVSNDGSFKFTNFLVGYIPKLSLVVLIEVFAYFFLSLYKTTLGEIKYFQNEITSIEAKYLSISLAVESNDVSCLVASIDTFAKIERNFILEKGQTTLDLERDRLLHKEKTDLIGKMADLLNRK